MVSDTGESPAVEMDKGVSSIESSLAELIDNIWFSLNCSSLWFKMSNSFDWYSTATVMLPD